MARSPASASPASASGINAPPAPRRRDRPSGLRNVLRHSLPLAGVVVVVVLVAAIAYFVYDANRRGAVRLSNDLITAIDRRVAVQMQSYLAPAQQFLELADAAAAGRGVFQGGRQAQQFAVHALDSIAPVTAFSYADPEGNFLFVIRNDKGGFDSKTIDRRSGKPVVTWARRDADGNVTDLENDPSDTFDPRTRPWYQGAENTHRPFWTDTYLFFTLKKPGVTFSIPHYDDDGKLGSVMGVDIELATLCTFLKQLSIGASGKAIIIDRNGRVVAYPSDNWMPADNPDVKAPLLDELGDPVLTRVYNELRVEGYGRRILDFGDRRVIVSSEPVRMMTDRSWVVLIVVPETDFVGFVTDSGVTALALSLLVVVIVAGLSGLLAWRNVVAERRVAAAAVRQEALEIRTRTFIDLARGSSDEESGDGAEGSPVDHSVESATENAAVACRAKRVAIWRLSRDGRTLACEDCYDGTVRDHISGLALHRDEMPNLFAALAKGETIDTDDAQHDRRTAELFASYLGPLEIRSVYIVPVAAHGRLMGMLTVEDPPRGDHAAGLAPFCEALAVVLALRYAAAAAPVPVAPRAAAVAAAAAAAAANPGAAAPSPEPSAAPDSFTQRHARLERTLLHQNASLDGLAASTIDRAAVGVIRLPDWTTVAQRPAGTGEPTAMDAIVQDLCRGIGETGVSYAALLDDQVVLAAFSPEKGRLADDAQCLAAAMICLRDRLLEFEDRWNTRLDFRLAIDVGTVMSSPVGEDPPSRNLWGGAVGVAKILAGTATLRTIAASETTYDLLSSQFLFRPRGTYFLPETGSMRTFVLVGRI